MKKYLVIIALLFISISHTYGQCKVENTFFKDGERLYYDMYFKLGFVTSFAGELKLSVEPGSYQGRGDHKMTFQTNTSDIANKIFPVHDTLYAYMTKDLLPIAYIKNALEGSDYTQEELTYNYDSKGKINIRTKRTRDGEFKFDEKLTSDTCIYDMVSVVYYARSLDFDSMKKNEKVSINFVSGKKKSQVDIEYKGTKKVKGNDGKRYDCAELILNFTAGGVSGKTKEMMKVYITTDKNRIPIEIVTQLKKLGSVRGVIKSYKGLRNAD